MTTFRLPNTLNYTTVESTSRLVTLSARAYGSRGRFHPLRIRQPVLAAERAASRLIWEQIWEQAARDQWDAVQLVGHPNAADLRV
jgi:hypothetical protein